MTLQLLPLLLLFLFGGAALGVTGTVLVGVVRRRRKKPAKTPPKRDLRAEVIDAAYAEIDRTEGGEIGLVFGLPPSRAPEAKREEPKMDRSGKIEVEGHPCTFLNGVMPPNFRPGECQGLCWHPEPGQRGRVCFWTAPSATNCSHFRPKVLPTRVRLKKIEDEKKSA